MNCAGCARDIGDDSTYCAYCGAAQHEDVRVSGTTRLERSSVHLLAYLPDPTYQPLVEALERWRFGSVPDNPSGWLYRVAKNRALDLLRHEEVVDRLQGNVADELRDALDNERLDTVFLDDEISDSQLLMMFACCDPDLPTESRIAITLKSLCGFGTREIADALLTSDANVHKRIQRARHRLREREDLLDVPSGNLLESRLDSVHAVLYLLFNEGYASSHSEEVIRRSLCEEAIRLCAMLAHHPTFRSGVAWALLALMKLHTARFAARLDDRGDIVLLEDQDRSQWDRALITQGLGDLERASETGQISTYHLEAAIAALHCMAPSVAETDWAAILDIYTTLTELKPSPIYQLNRAIALSKVQGPAAGIDAINRIDRPAALDRYHLFDATLGQLHVEAGDFDQARQALTAARGKTSSNRERALLDRKIANLKG